MSSLRTILMAASAEFIPQLHTPTYTITPNITTVNEGGTVTYTVNTTYVNNGTVLYWTTSGGAVAADFTDNAVDGSVVIMGQKARFTRVLAGDLTTEGLESFQIRLRTDSINGTVVASATNVDINDTSVPAGPTYAIAPSSTTVNEGSSITYTVTTSGVADNTTLFYTLTGTAGILDVTGGTLNGTVTIVGNTGTITVATVADTTTEGGETIIAQLRTVSISGSIVATAATVNVSDTSIAPVPTYSVSANASNINEGATVTVQVTTTNVADGTTLYWSTAGSVSAADFSDNTLTGSFTVTSGTGSFTRTAVSDTTTEGGEAMTISIRTGSVSGTVVGTTASITVNDTSTTPVGYGIDEIVVKIVLDPNTGWGTETYVYAIKPYNGSPCVIYWGDGTSTSYAANTNYTSHDYGTDTGEYIVRIKNAANVVLPQWWVDIIQWSNIPLMTMDGIFGEHGPGMTMPFTVGAVLPDTSQCTSFQRTFEGMPELANYFPIDQMDVSKGQIFWGTFGGCNGMTKSIASWDMSSATNIGIMFHNNTTFNQNISGWDVSKVQRFYSMFSGATAFNQNISTWDTSSAWDMHFMFSGASSFDQDLTSWCVGLIPWEPTDFANGNGGFTTAKWPIWGACPSGVIVPPPAARALADNTYADEGTTVTFTVETRNVANGTRVYWVCSGNASDFDTPMSGSVIVNGGSLTQPATATVYIDIAADGTDDGEQYFGLSFYLVQGGTRIGYSDGVTVNNTSY